VTRRRLLAAAATLGLAAAASWLPARLGARSGAVRAGSTVALPPGDADLARPALPQPQAWSARPESALAAVAAFVWSLAAAVAGNPAPAPPAPGARTAGAATPLPPAGDAVAESFARAYAHLSPAWRGRLPFAAFLREWAEVRRLEPLAILPAGTVPGEPRAGVVFVEARLLLGGPGAARPTAVQFVSGFYVASPDAGVYRIDSGSLRPETFSADGAAPGGAARAAEAAARRVALRLGRPGAASAAVVRLTPRPDHQATAAVRLGDETYTVHLYQAVDGSWVALSVEGAAASTAPISPPPSTASPS
jgi:hypothetical protein